MSEVEKQTGAAPQDPNSAETAKVAAQGDIVELDTHAPSVFCPNPAMTLWSQHPRVYLDLAVTGEAMCPYCGTRYRLAPGSKISRH